MKCIIRLLRNNIFYFRREFHASSSVFVVADQSGSQSSQQLHREDFSESPSILNVGPPLQLLGQLVGSDSSRAVNGLSRAKLRAAEADPQHMEGFEAEEAKALQGLQYLGLSLSFQGVRARPRAW